MFQSGQSEVECLQAINECNPQVIHFSGHGQTSEIILEGDDGKAFNVSRSYNKASGVCKNLKLVVFNICESELFAKEAALKVDFAVGMTTPIGDKAAIKFA